MDTSQTLNATQADAANLPLAVAFVAVEGVVALVEELRATLGEEACERVKKLMVDRLHGFPLSAPVQEAVLRSVSPKKD